MTTRMTIRFLANTNVAVRTYWTCSDGCCSEWRDNEWLVGRDTKWELSFDPARSDYFEIVNIPMIDDEYVQVGPWTIDKLIELGLAANVDPHARGVSDYHRKVGIRKSPFPNGSQEKRAWVKGWQAARALEELTKETKNES